jgi:serine/threonine-protein kinase RsbW
MAAEPAAEEDGPRPLLAERFDRATLARVRHAIARKAAFAGLAGHRLDDFVLAVNELMTNAVRHAGGVGRLRLWLQEGTLRCEVSDHGPGIAWDLLNGRRVPPIGDVGGRGLWLTRHLCDSLTLQTGPQGTTALAVMALR